ncbi:MAG: hypothetical protein HUU47_07675 [Bacteroidetes bacterium]|nr:hypothetical protein [Bacteroidota bacterium]
MKKLITITIVFFTLMSISYKITITIVFFTLMSISYKSFGQINLDISNATSCTYTIHVSWDDGTNCKTDSNIVVGSGPSYWTLGNPLGAGTSPIITVVCDNCGDIATIGDCNLTSVCACSSLVCCYTHTCRCGSPVNYRFNPLVIPVSNTLIEIF